MVKDPVANKVHDTVSTKAVLDPTGAPIRDLTAVRKQSIEDLVSLMQSSVNGHVSGHVFSAKYDLAYASVYSLQAYANSLKQAADAILEAHPGIDEGSDDLRYVSELCSALLTGASRVKEYLDAGRNFAQDLDRINTELQTQIQRLF